MIVTCSDLKYNKVSLIVIHVYIIVLRLYKYNYIFAYVTMQKKKWLDYQLESMDNNGLLAVNTFELLL